MTAAVLYLLLTYVVAAVPFGLVVTTLWGGEVDLRAAGSGNIGATNVARVHGWRLAAPTLALDALKGLVPVALARLAWPELPWMAHLVAVVAVAAHCWPVYLDFRGGKGVATGAGAMLALAWAPAGLGVAAWLLLFAIGGVASLSALVGTAVALGATAWLAPEALPVMGFVAAVVAWRHLAHARRDRRGDPDGLIAGVGIGRARAPRSRAEEALQQGPAGGVAAAPLWRGEADPLAGEE